jgi:hypothetical protein
MPQPSVSVTRDGVCFPQGGDGRRSTGATGRAIFADSARGVDAALAERIEHTRDWRSGYLRPVRDIVAAATKSPDAALTISSDGLASAHRRFRFARSGTEQSISEVMAQPGEARFDSVTIEGRVAADRDFSLPYQGKRLFGDDLRRQVDRWVLGGITEPSFAEAIHTLMDNPDWLDLRDVDIALLGAGAEMAPTRSLLRWGARVHAVDLPRPEAWRRLIEIARNTAGSLRVPVARGDHGDAPIVTGGIVHPDDDTAIAEVAGADLLADTPHIRTWLDEIEGPLILGTYVYADGAGHVLLSMASDAIATDLMARRDNVMLAYLATPTDVFMVPMSAVEESRRRWETRGINGILQSPLRLLNQFQPNNPETIFTSDGVEVGLNDSLVPQQGPNYALAKRLQRWRALTARAAGTTVSLNLAPPPRTQYVVKNRLLAAAYAGAGRFGIEVFEPATSTALMAALLVHDLRNPAAAANPATALSNPMDLFVQGANHGGLWRAAYSPRSVLGIAAVLGMFESRA